MGIPVRPIQLFARPAPGALRPAGQAQQPDASAGPSALAIVVTVLGLLVLYEGGKWALREYAA